ncbi:MAG TPA: outer-membrane lipoprotein carrier protein LolA [Blastocatellia bacterium]|nr:outer-membrane lipoprotein carrier protein LolA [Blastocatellia bacterium]
MASKIMHVTLVLFLSTTMLAATLAPSGSINGQVDQVLNNMQRAGSAVKTFQSDLLLEKRDVLIGGRPEVYQGTLIYKRAGKGNDKLRITYRSRDQVIQDLSVVGNKIVLYQPTINQVTITSREAQAARNPEFSFISTPYKSTAELKAAYDIVHLGDENAGGARCSVLELTPKAKGLLAKQDFWVSQSTWLPVKYKIWERNGEVSTFTLTNMKTNGDIPDSSFTIKWKDGTRELRK